MSRTLQWWIIVVAGALLCSGCALTKTVKENREISQRIRKDMIDFYENMAQAYYLLGFGYYQLHKQALANQNEAAAEQYKNNAVLYKRYYDDLMDSVRLMRKEFGIETTTEQEAPAFPPAVRPEQGATTRPAATAEPKIVPVAPPPEKRSLLGRLKFWRKKEPASPPPVPAPVGPSQSKGSLWQRLQFWK